MEKQDFHYGTGEVFEPITKTIETASEKSLKESDDAFAATDKAFKTFPDSSNVSAETEKHNI